MLLLMRGAYELVFVLSDEPTVTPRRFPFAFCQARFFLLPLVDLLSRTLFDDVSALRPSGGC